jgi:hypothetical protein
LIVAGTVSQEVTANLFGSADQKVSDSLLSKLPTEVNDEQRDTLKIGDRVTIKQSSPAKAKGCEVLVTGFEGDKVRYKMDGEKKTRLVTRTNIVTAPSNAAIDPTLDAGGHDSAPSPSTSTKTPAQLMTSLYHLLENDIFITPSEVYHFISAQVGWNSEEAFDPAPAPPSSLDLMPGNGLRSKWRSPAYINPPFSKIFEWWEKTVMEVECGNVLDCVLMMPSETFFSSGAERKRRIEIFYERVQHVPLRWCRADNGIVHHVKWGPNVLTGKRTGGPRFGVVLLRITPGKKADLHERLVESGRARMGVVSA